MIIKESRILKAFCLFQILINLTSFTGTYCSALIYNNFGDHPEYLGIIDSFATVATVLGQYPFCQEQSRWRQILSSIHIFYGHLYGCFWSK